MMFKLFDFNPDINTKGQFAKWLTKLKSFLESDDAKLVHLDIWIDGSRTVVGIAEALDLGESLGSHATPIKYPTYERKPGLAQEQSRCKLLDQVTAILDVLSGKIADEYIAKTPSDWAKEFGVTTKTIREWRLTGTIRYHKRKSTMKRLYIHRECAAELSRKRSK